MSVPAMTPDAARVLKLLAAGKTIQEAADATSWMRERVVALARAQKGWFLSAETDTVSDPGSPSGSVRLAAGVAELAARTDRLTYETALTRAEASADPKLRRLASTARTVLDDIMERLINTHQAAALAKEIEQLQQQLTAKQARHRQLLGRKAPDVPVAARPEAKVKRAGIRAWAVSQGLDCPQNGRIPKVIEQAYDEAHGGAQ